MSAYFSLRAANHVAQNTPHAARIFRTLIGSVLATAVLMTLLDLDPSGRQNWGAHAAGKAAIIATQNEAAKAACMARESAAYCAFVQAGD